jgi:hypothetical protein
MNSSITLSDAGEWVVIVNGRHVGGFRRLQDARRMEDIVMKDINAQLDRQEN